MRKRWRGGAADVTGSSEETLGNPVQHRMSASVALGCGHTLVDLPTVVSRACRPSGAVARHPPELRRCSVVQRTRNLVITILRLAGATSITAALRYRARRPSRPLRTIMK